MLNYVGIDVSKKTLDIALRRSGQKPKTYRVSNDLAGYQRLQTWLDSHAPIEQVGLEASGRYAQGVALFLYNTHYAVAYLNPRQVHAFSKAQAHYSKTDAQDALLIAHFCEVFQPRHWFPLSESQRHLQERSRRLQDLQQMYQQEQSRLQSGIDDPFVLEQINSFLTYLNAQIAAL